MSGLELVTMRPEALGWDQAVRLFLLRGRSKNIAEGTLRLYERHLGAFLRWLAENGNAAPAEVTATHLRGWLDACKSRGNRSTTVDCAFRILRTFWRFLLRDGLIIVDPMEKVERPR